VQQDLCPFARRELDGGRVRYSLTYAVEEIDLLGALEAELELLSSDSSVETTLLIHPYVLQDFADFNQFLDDCDRLLLRVDLEGVYQIASFHPQYQFADTEPEDVENYTNRSPYPMLHILREDSVERAVAGHPDIDRVPAQNSATLSKLGKERLQAMWQACFDE
jgi:hypothetical protein